MLTNKSQLIIDLAKDFAFSHNLTELTHPVILASIVNQTEARLLLSECFNLPANKIQEACPKYEKSKSCPGKLPLAEPVRNTLALAKELSEDVPTRFYPGLIDVQQFVCALAMSREICAIIGVSPISKNDAVALLMTWDSKIAQTPKLEDLTENLRIMREELMSRVFGQDHAIHAFIEGLFSAEVVAGADTKRRAPKGLFVFAGPPGVGKTYLAELGASYLKRPFKRFDMSAYSSHHQNEALVGMSKGYREAHPGQLTEFVAKNPNAILLFDEIEKAHINTIQLFLQILDAGVLEDKYHESNVKFRDTIIIFTTNVGKKLYNSPNTSGIHNANAAFHRKTILDSLKNEKDPSSGQPFFPAAICSRMAMGTPVLFNYLGVNELERVAYTELKRQSNLLELQYYKKVSFHKILPMCLVLKEGAQTDARMFRSQVEGFIKTELFKFCQLYKVDNLEDVFSKTDSINFTMENNLDELDSEIKDLFISEEHPKILIIADTDLTDLYKDNLVDVEWRNAQSADDALQILANEEIDMILLDLWLGGQSLDSGMMTHMHFDHTPAASRGLDQGQETLRKIRNRCPNIPVYLLSLIESEDDEDYRSSIDNELFMACVRGGGTRGIITSSFIDGMVKGWENQRDILSTKVKDICLGLHREKSVNRMRQERKLLTFDTAPITKNENKEIIIRLRNLQISRAIAASDVGEILDDVERPNIKFEDVIGADAAKNELKFFIDYLKKPRRFNAMGLKPPKGVLLYGPPGTGKTMLARAMAGESNLAFIPVSATNFVTIWQGSGPQNVRDLFARARRYAPAIVFIDEIDAIGKVRTGSAGAGQAEENTLNALLTELDGFTSPSPDRPVFVLAATNFNIKSEDDGASDRTLRLLDPALVRRFSRTILVDLPDKSARLQYLKLRLENKRLCNVSNEAINLIAEKSVGMSIANLEMVIEAATRKAIKSEGELNNQLLEDALEEIRYGESRLKNLKDLKRTACHEAGHTILYWLSGWWPAYVTVVSRGSHGGYMAPCTEDIERRENRTRDELLFDIRVSLAGRAAELVYYGNSDGLTTGASSDLRYATKIAKDMICNYGMYQDFGLMASPELLSKNTNHGSFNPELNRKINEILNEQMEKTITELNDNRKHLDSVIAKLMDKNRLTDEDLQKILPPISNSKKQI